MNASTENTTTDTANEDVSATVEGLPQFVDKGDTIEATAKALFERGFAVNGSPASLNDISALAHLKLLPVVGIAAKEPKQRGPKGKVFSVPMGKPDFKVTLRR